MPHIHTQPGQHDHTVSAFIIVESSDEPQLLLHWHKKLNGYMQFGGHIELHENPWQAVIREIQEESGYAPDQLSILQPAGQILSLTGAIVHPVPVNYNTHPIGPKGEHYHTDAAYAFITTQEPRLILSDNESSHTKLFTKSELQQLDSHEIYENVREIGMYIFETCLAKWQRVPATVISSGLE